MKITRESDYALRIVLFLAEIGQDNRVGAKIVSESQVVPLRFTLKILRKLNQAGITKSYRGAKGGYALNLPPQKITIKGVVEAIEGPIHLNPCLLDESSCNRNMSANCAVHASLERVQNILIDELESIDFAKLLQE